jgi:hypothetical protein
MSGFRSRISLIMSLHEDKFPLVRSLTRSVVEVFAPHKLAHFEEEFAPFALSGGLPQVQERISLIKGRDQGLDTTLVAGMFFQVLVEAEQLPASTPERVSFVRKQAKSFLVNRLAGQISLSQFFRLLSLIDENVQGYFDRLRLGWSDISTLSLPVPTPVSIRGPEDNIKTEALRQALAQIPMTPKGRRKLTHETLGAFLRDTEGRWFKLLDSEAQFQVNKKTAWAYLNQLLHAGILEHNGERANKVRYTLASRFQKQGPAL